MKIGTFVMVIKGMLATETGWVVGYDGCGGYVVEMADGGTLIATARHLKFVENPRPYKAFFSLFWEARGHEWARSQYQD
jgi:hypothetical protein